MKSMLVAAAAVLTVIGLSSASAEAAGCVKGAVVGASPGTSSDIMVSLEQV